MKQAIKHYTKMFSTFLRRHKMNNANCITSCSKRAGIGLNPQNNKNFNRNTNNSKAIPTNFHMAGSPCSKRENGSYNYKKATLSKNQSGFSCYLFHIVNHYSKTYI